MTRTARAVRRRYKCKAGHPHVGTSLICTWAQYPASDDVSIPNEDRHDGVARQRNAPAQYSDSKHFSCSRAKLQHSTLAV